VRGGWETPVDGNNVWQGLSLKGHDFSRAKDEPRRSSGFIEYGIGNVLSGAPEAQRLLARASAWGDEIAQPRYGVP